MNGPETRLGWNIASVRDLRARPRVDLSRPLPHPLTVYLETTNVCNFRCTYCPESLEDYWKQGFFQLSIPGFERICDQILELGQLKTLNLFVMGEPFVNKNLTDMIALAKAKGVAERIIVASNGSLLKDPKALVESGLDYLRVSVYGGRDDSHKRRTKSGVPLVRIWQNMDALKTYRDSVHAKNPSIQARMLDCGEPENSEFLSLFADVCDEATIEPLHNWNEPKDVDLSGIGHDAMMATDYFKNKKEACPFPFYTLCIHSDLKVGVCSVDWAKQATVGNLKEETLAQIWNGERLRQFRLAHIERRRDTIQGCKDCTYLHQAPDNIDHVSVENFLGAECRT